MLKSLLSLLPCIAFAACADHSSSMLAARGPGGPLNDGDSGVFDSQGGSGTTAGPSATSGNTSLPGEPMGPGGTNPEPPDGKSSGQPVPEPSTLLLVGTGLAGLALLRRRQKPAHA